MFSRGTSVAAWNPMNDRLVALPQSDLAPVCTEAPSCGDHKAEVESGLRPSFDREELDKYDLSTLACTD
jgi:hypothetical protein